MTEESRKANIRAEVEKGESSLVAAQTLFAAGLHDECVRITRSTLNPVPRWIALNIRRSCSASRAASSLT